jgi:hypothetical protein
MGPDLCKPGSQFAQLNRSHQGDPFSEQQEETKPSLSMRKITDLARLALFGDNDHPGLCSMEDSNDENEKDIDKQSYDYDDSTKNVEPHELDWGELHYSVQVRYSSYISS